MTSLVNVEKLIVNISKLKLKPEHVLLGLGILVVGSVLEKLASRPADASDGMSLRIAWGTADEISQIEREREAARAASKLRDSRRHP